MTTFYTFDERGNVSQRLTNTGSISSTDAYNSYGTRSSTVSAQPDPWGYEAEAGYYTDTETGLILCTHRFYDPTTGRWLTRDPIGYDGGINLYGYVENDPTSETDALGLAPDWMKIWHTCESVKKPILACIAAIGGILLCKRIHDEMVCAHAIQEARNACQQELDGDDQADSPDGGPGVSATAEGGSGNELQMIQACIQKKLKARNMPNINACIGKLYSEGVGSYSPHPVGAPSQ